MVFDLEHSGPCLLPVLLQITQSRHNSKAGLMNVAISCVEQCLPRIG